jgi:prephenate dehydrogenase
MNSRVSRSALRKRRDDVNEVKVAVLGLDRISASVALGLRAYSERPNATVVFNVIGRDADKEAMKTAHKNGLIDNYHRNLPNVVNDAAIVIVNEPLSELDVLFERMGPILKDGAVVIDFSRLKRPAVKLANQHFKKDLDGNPKAYLVGATPMVSFDQIYAGDHSVEGAQEFLFRNNDMLIVPGAKVPPEAVKVVTDISEFLGMKPRFLDPLEHDGLSSLTESIPMLMSVMFMQAVQQSPGTTDIQRAGNLTFASTLENLRRVSAEDMVTLWRSNKTALLQQMEVLMTNMESMHQMLTDDLDEPGVMESYIEALIQSFVAWEVKREKNRWDDPQDNAMDSINTGLAMLGGGNFVSRRKHDDE